MNRVTSEFVFQIWHTDTGMALRCSREESNLHLVLYQRDVADGMRSPWVFPVA